MFSGSHFRTGSLVLALVVAVAACSSRMTSERILPAGEARHALSVSGSYDAAVLALSPYAYYRLDETSGTVANDASGNGRNGTYQGTSGTHYLLGQPSVVPGLSGSAKVFAANPGAPKVALPSLNVASNGTSWVSDFTMALWAKPDPSQIAQATGAIEINDYYLGQGNQSGGPSTTPYMGAYPIGNWAASPTTFADGRAHFLAESVHRNTSGTCDLILYADGVAVQSAAGTRCTGKSNIVYASNAGIGGRVSYVSGYAAYFGEIGGVAIFSSALTAGQIADLFNSAAAAPTPTPAPSPTPLPGYDAAVLSLSPYAYYRLDETSGTIANDSSGNGRNGTYQGTNGTHYLLGQTSIVPGLSNSAEVFSANPGAPKVSLPSMNLASDGTTWMSDFSVTLWAKPDPSSIAQATGTVEINDYYMGQGGPNGSASTTPYMGAYPTGNWPASPTTFADGKAHFLAETVHRNAGGTCDLTLYADGAVVQTAFGTQCTGHNVIVATTNAGIGGRVSYSPGYAAYFGEIGGVAIFSSALTQTQIAGLFNATPAVPSPSPTPVSRFN